MVFQNIKKLVKKIEVPAVLTKSSLELKIEKTAARRDSVTRRLTSSLISPAKSVDKFVVDACKFAKITPPKKGEALAPFVYRLQKKVCKFEDRDYGRGCDGKLGPITFAALLNKIPQLKAFSKEFRTAKFKKERKQLVKSAGLPPLPTKKNKDEAISENQKSTVGKALTSGDSLTVQYAAKFYRGTGKYRKYRNRIFKGAMSIRWMRRKLQKYPDRLRNSKTLILGGGANDIYYRSPEWILREARKIIEFARSVNPNIRIIVLKLHGDGCNYWRRKAQRTKNKLLALNRGFDRLVSEYSNIKAINVRNEIRAAAKKGKRMLLRDGLHYNRRGSRALAAKLKDEVETGTSKSLHEY